MQCLIAPGLSPEMDLKKTNTSTHEPFSFLISFARTHFTEAISSLFLRSYMYAKHMTNNSTLNMQIPSTISEEHTVKFNALTVCLNCSKNTNVSVLIKQLARHRFFHADHYSFVQVLSKVSVLQHVLVYKLLPIMITSLGKPSILATSKQPSLL